MGVVGPSGGAVSGWRVEVDPMWWVTVQPGMRQPWSRSSTIRRVRSGTMRWVRPTEIGMEPSMKTGDISPSQVAHLVVRPPGRPVGDDDHLVDGEFATAQRLDRFGEFARSAG